MELTNEPVLTKDNLLNIRRWCVERALELLKGDSALRKDELGICGVQDLKLQIVDCAEALSEFILNGTKIGSTVGKTPSLLSATRLLRDRNIALSVREFNTMAHQCGFLEIKKISVAGMPNAFSSLTEKGKEYGENKAKPFSEGITSPYYYDNKFDELLQKLGITEDSTKTTSKTVVRGRPKKK